MFTHNLLDTGVVPQALKELHRLFIVRDVLKDSQIAERIQCFLSLFLPVARGGGLGGLGGARHGCGVGRGVCLGAVGTIYALGELVSADFVEAPDVVY